MSEVIEIAIDTPKNGELFFRPISRRVRGTFDSKRLSFGRNDAMAKWPDQIPGQILGVNVETGVGYIVDPLHDPANELLKAKVEKSLGKVPPAREDFRDIDMATWLHFIKKAVHSGTARLVRGSLPDVLPGKPRLDFITKTRKPLADALTEVLDRFAAAMERQADALEQIVAKSTKPAK